MICAECGQEIRFWQKFRIDNGAITHPSCFTIALRYERRLMVLEDDIQQLQTSKTYLERKVADLHIELAAVSAKDTKRVVRMPSVRIKKKG